MRVAMVEATSEASYLALAPHVVVETLRGGLVSQEKSRKRFGIN